MYRRSDLQFIQNIFDRATNDIAIIYGLRDYGLFELVSDFIKDKDCLYYRSSPVTDDFQRKMFAQELHEQTKSPIFPDDDYDKLLASYIDSHNEKKKVIVLDDFQFLIRENPTFINFLSNMLFGQTPSGKAMYLLVSDDIKWIESDMVKLIGRKSSEISGVIKLKGFSPAEFSERFPKMTTDKIIKLYSVLGGRSMFYNMITEETDTGDAVKLLLNKWSSDDFNVGNYLPKDIREPVIYNTILVNIALGKCKLNDIHNSMGMDRAKLSAYLKNLESNDIIEKLLGAQVGDLKCIKKGTYRIKDNTLRLFYRFVFPRLSSLKIFGEDKFYKRFIEANLPDFIGKIYPEYCMEHIRWLHRENRLSFMIDSVEEYFDKSEAIDFVIVAKGGNIIACACNYKDPVMSYKKLTDVREAIRRNRLPCDNIWMFSAGDFEDKLIEAASSEEGIKLLELSEQTVR